MNWLTKLLSKRLNLISSTYCSPITILDKPSGSISTQSGRQSGMRLEMTYIEPYHYCPINTWLCYLAGRSVCWPDST